MWLTPGPPLWEDEPEEPAALVYLRWLAVAGQVAAIGLTAFWFQIDLPIVGMGCVMVCLIGLNLFTLHRSRSKMAVSNLELLGELLLDVTALTEQLSLFGEQCAGRGAVSATISPMRK